MERGQPADVTKHSSAERAQDLPDHQKAALLPSITQWYSADQEAYDELLTRHGFQGSRYPRMDCVDHAKWYKPAAGSEATIGALRGSKMLVCSLMSSSITTRKILHFIIIRNSVPRIGGSLLFA